MHSRRFFSPEHSLFISRINMERDQGCHRVEVGVVHSYAQDSH